MKKIIDLYESYRKKLKAYEYVFWLIGWDQETEAPKKSGEYRSKQYQVLAEQAYAISSDPKFIEAIETLYNNLDKIEDEDFKIEIKQAKKELRMVQKVPKDEYIEYQVLTQRASQIWEEAKNSDDFEMFAPTLEKIIVFNKKLVKYLETEELKGYDILLDMYEEGFSVGEYDKFFADLKEELVPFVLEVTTRPKDKFSRKLTKGRFPKDKQEQFSKYLLEVFNYDQNKGLLKESAHPFTSGVSSVDTRITTHYYEDNLLSSIFSTIHELGHGIYELQNDPKYDDTNLHGGTSLGIHESQSRMYENMIGRSYSFWTTHYPKLVEIFPKQLKNISVGEFYRFANQAKRSLIRVEADELTYSLHIMVRYELEKELINGKLKVKDLPKKWRQLMGRYVGKRPKTFQDGVLQDIHWSGGAIGYFPTYALGSAYAAQIYKTMSKEIDVDKAIEENNIALINNWLKEHVHKFAKTKTPKEILLISSKEEFNAKYYIEHLKEKFSLRNQ